MSILLEIRDYIQKFYQKYAAVLNVILRFLAAFITFFATNRVIGFNPYLDHTYTELVFAAVSVVFPAQILLFFEAVFITLHILYVSHYLAFVTAIFFAILYFVYVRFIPKDGYVILSMPVLSSFGAPYILPILLGIIADPIAIIPESIGVIVYHYLQNVISVVSTSTEDSINLYHLVLKQTFKDKELYIILIVFSIVTIFVYFIRNSKIDYSFEIAIISGGFLNTILLLFMNFFMDINITGKYKPMHGMVIPDRLPEACRDSNLRLEKLEPDGRRERRCVCMAEFAADAENTGELGAEFDCTFEANPGWEALRVLPYEQELRYDPAADC